MAIRIRTVNGTTVALCAVEADPQDGDIYLDDGVHHALAAKFAQDWSSSLGVDLPEYPDEWAVMDSQKVRDARTEITKWTRERAHG